MPSPVFSKAKGLGHVCQRSSLVPDDLRQNNRNSIPLPADAKADLGMTGTMGKSSRTFKAHAPDIDTGGVLVGRSDEDSVDDTVSYCPEEIDGSPVNPSADCAPLPNTDQPVFRALVIDDEDNHADIDGGLSSEDDTKRSFDFTGELKRLNESGGSDRRSFVEQLENASQDRVVLRFWRLPWRCAPASPNRTNAQSRTKQEAGRSEHSKYFGSYRYLQTRTHCTSRF